MNIDKAKELLEKAVKYLTEYEDGAFGHPHEKKQIFIDECPICMVDQALACLEPKCQTCGGDKEICNGCKKPRSKIFVNLIDEHRFSWPGERTKKRHCGNIIPCPDCQPKLDLIRTPFNTYPRTTHRKPKPEPSKLEVIGKAEDGTPIAIMVPPKDCQGNSTSSGQASGEFDVKPFIATCEVAYRDCKISEKQIQNVLNNTGLLGVRVRLMDGAVAAKEGLKAAAYIEQLQVELKAKVEPLWQDKTLFAYESSRSPIIPLLAENKQLEALLEKVAAYADTSWYQGSPSKSDTATFFYKMRAIERHIEQALKGGTDASNEKR